MCAGNTKFWQTYYASFSSPKPTFFGEIKEHTCCRQAHEGLCRGLISRSVKSMYTVVIFTSISFGLLSMFGRWF